MIYPTLFVGLGSTGLDILQRLQQLVSEEYKGKPPIFEYVYFETIENSRPSDLPWLKDEITVPERSPIVENLPGLMTDFASGRKEYLRAWLNPKVLEFPDKAFKAGAGHVRMAGRLCLWENWSTCKALLDDARGRITSNKNRDAAREFLRGFYNRVNKRLPPNIDLVGNDPNVYVFGTLCGGTGSGMFLDVAYLLRNLFGLRAITRASTTGTRPTAKLQGVFTIPDSRFAEHSRDDLEKKRCANAWASLLELDYYSHPQTVYDFTWPNGDDFATREPPFDWVYLASCTGNQTNLRCADGTHDEEALNQMIALFLFTETIADLLTEKNEIRVNFMGLPRFNTPRPGTETMPLLATFGLSAVWYPKYRLAEASACQEAIEVCKTWLGTLDQQTKLRLEEAAKSEWERMLRMHLPMLTRKAVGSIEDELRAWFQAEKESLIKASWSETAETLSHQLARFAETKEFDAVIADPLNLSGFENALKLASKDALHAVLNGPDGSVAAANAFLKAFDQQVELTLSQLPIKYPAADGSRIPTSISADFYATFLLLHRKVEAQKKATAVNSFLDYLLELLARIRGFRCRGSLEKLRQEIGVGVSFTAQEARVFETRASDLAAFETTLQGSISALASRSKNLSELPKVTQNMKVINKDQQGGVEKDILDLSTRLRVKRPEVIRRCLTSFLDGKPIPLKLSDFLRSGEKTVSDIVVREIRRDALDLVVGFNIAETLINRASRAGSTMGPEELRQFARRSLPHLETGGELPVPGENPMFMVGGDDALNAPALTSLRDMLGDPNAASHMDFGTPVNTPLLDHFLFFYNERGLLYTDENLATSFDLAARYNEVARTDPYGLHTHKNGYVQFDKLIMKRQRESEELVAIVTHLFFYRGADGLWNKAEYLKSVESTTNSLTPSLCLMGQNLVLSYTRQDGTPGNVVIHDDYGRKRLADDPENFGVLENQVLSVLKSIGPGYAQLLTEHLNRALEAGQSRGEPVAALYEAQDEKRAKFLEIKDRLMQRFISQGASVGSGRHGN